MNDPINILLALGYPKNDTVREELEQYGPYRIRQTSNDVDEVLSEALNSPPDFLFMNLELRNGDANMVARQLSKLAGPAYKRPTMILLSGSRDELVLDSFFDPASMCLFFLPMDTHRVASLMNERMRKRQEAQKRADKFDRAVKLLLYQLKVPPALSGYRMMVIGMRMAHEDASCLDSMMVDFYPVIAREMGIGAAQVERNLRTSITTMCKKGENRDMLLRVFGSAERHTNRRFFTLCLQFLDWHWREYADCQTPEELNDKERAQFGNRI